MSEISVYITSDREEALNLVNELKAAGITQENIGASAKGDTPLDELPNPDAEFHVDAIAGAKRGLGIGGAAGVLAGMAAKTWIGPA